jgi:folate-dependent phosphoribosylglycinamide formyltransferase PurN
MLSGSGRTLLNLLDYIRDGSLPATVDLVIASRECLGAQRARDAGLRVEIVPGVIPAARLGDLLAKHRIDWVVLAGYLKLIQIPPAYQGRIVNIHPALLPDFGGPGMYGDRVHEAVLKAKSSTSGCTVHFVDEQFDHGQIIIQRSCPVLPGDTPHTLADRVFALECEAYPAALNTLLAGTAHTPRRA